MNPLTDPPAGLMELILKAAPQMQSVKPFFDGGTAGSAGAAPYSILCKRRCADCGELETKRYPVTGDLRKCGCVALAEARLEERDRMDFRYDRPWR